MVERAIKMEGAFGIHKNHYHLNRIKARTGKNEILWIFFGIHINNLMILLISYLWKIFYTPRFSGFVKGGLFNEFP